MASTASPASTPLTLHEDPISGNCYKIRLTAALLGIQLQIRSYDIGAGETRTPDFLANINACGRIPVLQIGTQFLPESNAACIYLAEESASSSSPAAEAPTQAQASASRRRLQLIPQDRFQRACMYRWLFFEQNLHEPCVATLRSWRRYNDRWKHSAAFLAANVPLKMAGGEDALACMERHLDGNDNGGGAASASRREWFVGEGLTLADICLYAYTHVAGQGGFQLEKYPRISEWLRRVEAVDGWFEMKE